MSKTLARFALLLALASPLAATGQPTPAPDRLAHADGHAALRLRADGILARLLDAAETTVPDARRRAWEVQVVGRGLHDAEAFDGGQIRLSARFVSQLALDDAELAMLLAHEVAHVLAGDARQRAMSASGVTDRAPRPHALARQQELDADAKGFALATGAGYRAEALRGFYRKVLAKFGNLENATHPPVAERLRRLASAGVR